jgi:hypothetical protein
MNSFGSRKPIGPFAILSLVNSRLAPPRSVLEWIFRPLAQAHVPSLSWSFLEGVSDSDLSKEFWRWNTVGIFRSVELDRFNFCCWPEHVESRLN